jgi:HAD superfamily hydrolase (TIGR01509 family)
VRVVLFDCDGVLINSEDLIEEAQQEAYAAFGLDLSLDFIRANLTGLAYEEYMRRRAEVYAEGTGRTLPEDYQARLQEIFAEKAKARLRTIDGMPELLQALQDAGVPFAVASNSGINGLQKKLQQAGLHGLFDPHIYSRDHVARGKPAPDVYLHALARLGDFDPADAIVVEDSPPGVQAGVAAGMHVIGFARHGATQAAGLRAAGARDIVTAANDLKTRVFQLLGRTPPPAAPGPQP